MKKKLPNPLELIAGWFGKDDKKRPVRPNRPPGKEERPADPITPVIDVISEMEKTLTDLHRSGGIATAGRVQVLRFDKLRKKLGDKWARYSDRIERVIDSSISQQLSGQDMRWKLGRHAHVLIFTSVTPEEAEVKCALIRAKVEEFFQRMPQLQGMIEVETAVAALDGSVRLQSIADLETLYNRLNLEKKQEAKTDEPLSSQTARGPIEDLETRKKPPPKQEQVNWQEHTDSVDAARNKIETNRFIDQLVWDTTEKIIVAAAIMPADPTPENIGRGGSVLKEWTGGAMTFALDEASIQCVRADKRPPASIETPFIWLQTHYGSYENQKFRNLLIKSWDKLEDIGADKRIIELIGLPKNPKHTPHSEFFNTLSKYAGEFAICLDLGSPQLNFLHHGNVRWIGFTMRDSNLDEEAGMDAIANFVAKASAPNVKLYARDIPSRNLVAAAIGFGIRYIFSNPAEHLEGAGTPAFNIDDLYNRS